MNLLLNDFPELSESECISIQNKLSSKIVQRCPLAFEEIQTVAGAYYEMPRKKRQIKNKLGENKCQTL